MSLASQIRIRLEQGVPAKRIAQEVGCSVRYVYDVGHVQRNLDYYREHRRRYQRERLRRQGVKPRTEIDWPNDLSARARKLRRDGLSAAQIGQIIGKSRNAVVGHLWRLER